MLVACIAAERDTFRRPPSPTHRLGTACVPDTFAIGSCHEVSNGVALVDTYCRTCVRQVSSRHPLATGLVLQ